MQKIFCLIADKDYIAIITSAIKPENFIAQSGEGIVYKIPDTSYCIKILAQHSERNKEYTSLRTNVTEQEKN